MVEIGTRYRVNATVRVRMAYRDGSRYQMTALPPVIDDYVGPEDPVRAYDAIINAMDVTELGLVIDSSKVGNPSYDPKSMLKLLVYGYSYGWRSSRKLERALYHNLSFIWLMGGSRITKLSRISERTTKRSCETS